MTPIEPENSRSQLKTAPPGAWRPVRNLTQAVLAPVERFLAIETSSGLLLLFVSLVALIWANSSWFSAYQNLWHTSFGLTLGPWSFERDLHFWINDGLMTIFFFVVGLEIRREMHKGELSELRRAALPLFAALGGMAVPALLYFFFNAGRSTASGWGIPMATDIAFAVGVVALLGKRIPAALRIFLLTLAVIDDIGAILVIAIFYSADLSAAGFAVAGLGLALIFIFQKIGIRSPWAYLGPALIVWAGTYAGGIHPTIAGVVIGLFTPVRAWLGPDGFLNVAEKQIDAIRSEPNHSEDKILPHLGSLDTARKEAVSPVERLQFLLHGWVAFGIMPLFALANAGVPLGQASFDGDGREVFTGVLLGLLIGKPIGVILLSFLAVKLKIAQLPRGVSWIGVTIVGLSAGIGFTMAIFISQLAFPPGQVLETAKLSILCASALAAFIAFLAGWILLKPTESDGSARTPAEAEASTEL